MPDCRAYEQVSPVDKGGYNAVNWLAPSPSQGALDGERVFYQGPSAFPGAQTNVPLNAGHVSVRTANGWHTIELTPRDLQLFPEHEGLIFYQALSEELNQVVIKAPEALTETANRYAYNLYSRELSTESSWSSAEYRWLNDLPLLAPTTEACEARVGSGLPGEASCFEALAFAGATPQLTHVLLESKVQLLAEAPKNGIEALYENFNGEVRLVGVLPDGDVAANGSSAGAGSLTIYPGWSRPLQGERRVDHAISADGERVVFEAKSDEGRPDEKGQAGMSEIYDRIGNTTDEAHTIELSAPAPGAAPKTVSAQQATFWAASTDGSRVFFTSKAELTTQSNTGIADNSEDLYEYDVATETLTDLSVDDNPNDASTGPGVLGVVGASEDGEYVYFVADGELVAGKGVDGEPNLYVERDGRSPRFIATLHVANTADIETEEAEPGDSLDWLPYQEVQRSYVTPDGRHLGFMSIEKVPTSNFPSGYDNTDLRTGKPDSEVYEYSAPSVEAEEKGMIGEVLCVSCDPTGARPAGSAYIAGAGEEVNGVNPNGASSPFYHVRAVSDSGARVFFTAPPFASETIASSEETSALKVYEYEQEGEGTCSVAAGCTFRISAATNPTNDMFIDASAEGKDVFFSSYSQLAPSDHDALIDVYDARIGGGFPSTDSLACESGCRGAPAAPPAGPALLSDLTGASGNLIAPAVLTSSTKPKSRPATCQSKARRIKNAKERRRALKRCAGAARRGRASKRPSQARRSRNSRRAAAR